jgi:hypothetical protein
MFGQVYKYDILSRNLIANYDYHKIHVLYILLILWASVSQNNHCDHNNPHTNTSYIA